MNRAIKWVIAAVSVGVVIAFAIGLSARREQTQRAQAPATKEHTTIAQAWTIEAGATSPEADESTPAGATFSPEAVRQALAEVRIDENRNVIVDSRTLAALRDGLSSLGSANETELAKLQASVREGLPAPAGEQTATIIGNYYHYQHALRAMPPSQEQLEAATADLDRMIELRHAYFGPEMAERLFGEEQAYARVMIENLQLESDASLSEADKDRRRAKPQQALPATMRAPADVEIEPARRNESSDWPQRYAEYSRQKQAILDSGLPDEEQRAQLERLLREHFVEEEIEMALHYDPEARGPTVAR